MTSRAPAPTPAHLFLDYWTVAAALTEAQRTSALKTTREFEARAREMATMEDPEKAAAGLAALATGPTDVERRGRMLSVMNAIDMAFSTLHPRTPRAPTRRAPRPPSWLLAMQDRRFLDGFYISTERFALVPRGPLLRTARDPDASSADTLEDRFAYLAALPRILDHNGRNISVSIKCVGSDLLTGVEPIAKPGNERIAFIPVAEGAADLDICMIERGGNPHIHYGPAAAFAGGQRLADALTTLGGHDIAVAPELVMNPDQTALVQEKLRTASGSPRFVLLGTGNSAEHMEGMAFNEAVLVNSVGSELWRQRKVWPAKLGPSEASKLGLCETGTGTHYPEDNASGQDLQLVDIDGFGRVLVLICQDLKSPAIAPLVQASQPDWILVPILADNLAQGRWAHRQALAISENAQSRFVGVTSSTLAHRYGSDPATIGFALGPARIPDDADPEEMERAVAFVTAEPASSPAVGVTSWHGPGWIQSFVGATPVDGHDD